MVSIKHMIDCLGYFRTGSHSISIIRDFYGLMSLPRTMTYTGVSLLKQVQLLQGRHFQLNIIHVGLDKETDEHKRELNRLYIAVSIQAVRKIFMQVNIGIGRIQYFVIGSDVANGHEVIDNRAEAKDLTKEWSVPNEEKNCTKKPLIYYIIISID